MRTADRLKLWLTGAAATFIILNLTPAGASSANISHAYKANSPIGNGSLVILDSKDPGTVQLANIDNGKQLLGVVTTGNDSLLAIDAGAGKVQVATSGTVSTLVSTLNGNIKTGDRISASPFNGIGTKSLPGAYVIGLAQTSFDAGSDGAAQRQVTDRSGRNRQISVGYVRLNVAISPPTGTSDNENSGLQRWAKSLTGHEVSTARVVISLVVTLLAFLALIILIYASIFGGIISIGRNPLAKYAVFRTIGAVLVMALGLTSLAAGLIYLLLR
jgi:hypothetical protein